MLASVFTDSTSPSLRSSASDRASLSPSSLAAFPDPRCLPENVGVDGTDDVKDDAEDDEEYPEKDRFFKTRYLLI
jgi:hypothetical protein